MVTPSLGVQSWRFYLLLKWRRNPFSKKVSAHVQDANEIFERAGASQQSVGIDGMNKPPLGGEKDGRTVGMDGMNKAPPKGGLLIGLLV